MNAMQRLRLTLIGPLVILAGLAALAYVNQAAVNTAQINRFGGNISRTASFVGMERSALHRKLKSLGVVTTSKSGGRMARLDEDMDEDEGEEV